MNGGAVAAAAAAAAAAAVLGQWDGEGHSLPRISTVSQCSETHTMGVPSHAWSDFVWVQSVNKATDFSGELPRRWSGRCRAKSNLSLSRALCE